MLSFRFLRLPAGLSLVAAVACGGKTLDDSAERRADGGSQGPVPSNEAAAPVDGGTEASTNLGGPSMAPPDGENDPTMLDPGEAPLERCRQFCELPEVQCQQSLGGSVAACTDACATTAANMGSTECRELFLGVLVCLEEIVREVDCQEEFTPPGSERCADRVATYAATCPSV